MHILRTLQTNVMLFIYEKPLRCAYYPQVDGKPGQGIRVELPFSASSQIDPSADHTPLQL